MYSLEPRRGKSRNELNPKVSSNSALDAVPSITLSIESSDAEVTNPTIANLETDERITFNGVVGSGQKLAVKDRKATLDKTDVRKSMSTNKVPRLLRKDRSNRSVTKKQVEGVTGSSHRASFLLHHGQSCRTYLK